MNSCNKNYFWTEERIFEYFLILGLFFFQFSPISSITIRFALLLILLLSCLFYKNFHVINNVRFLIVTFVISVFLIFYHGIAEAKDYFITCFGFVSLSYFSNKFNFTGNIVYKYFLYVILPLSIINLFLYNNITYLPFDTGQVNIVGGNSTKHATATIGTILFVGAGYNILKFKRCISKIDIIYLVVSIYLVVFSGSRSCLLALLTTLVIYIINYKKFRKLITSIFFCVMLLSVFFMEYIKEYVYVVNNDFILDLIHADDFKQYGVTSGRAWLWNYHWNSFVHSPFLLGDGRSATDFIMNQYIPSLGIKAPAASESPYTGMLACYGLLSFFPFFILIYLTLIAIIKNNLLATCIIFICIYNTLMGVYLTSVMHADAILMFILYFSSYKRTDLDSENMS